jgi:hypothetical protein
MDQSIINLADYTITQHILFALGCLLWVITYLIVIKNIRKYQFIEIPIIAVTANFAWEFLWSFVFMTDMGLLYVWGYRLWFFLDCYIVFGLFMYGYKQIEVDSLRTKSALWIAFAMACSFYMLYYYIERYDAPLSHMGAYSGYILNVMMSALYIPLLLRMRDKPFSQLAAWCKGVGTFLISIFCYLKFEDPFLISMCVVTTLLDVIYIYYIMQKRADSTLRPVSV